jgi:hypothetical protein
MKKLITLISCASIVNTANAQLANNANIHISEGATVSVNTPIQNNGKISNNGKMHIRNNIKNDASMVSAGEIVLDGNNRQEISGSSSVSTNKLNISNDVILRTAVNVKEEATFNQGIVNAERPLHFEEGAKATGASDYSHVNGTVRKSGSESFTFPVGDGSSVRPFEVLNPKASVEASYVGRSPLSESSALDQSLEQINETEYWILKSDSKDKVQIDINTNDALAVLDKGVWVKQDKSLNAENGAKFTSGKGSYLQKEIGVWPNPTQGEFNLKLSGMNDNDKITVEIVNQDGRGIMNMTGTVKELRKVYTLPRNLAATNLTVRVINGAEAMTQNLILHR